MMDMDGLKDINDSYGHSEGDAVLAKAGQLLRGCFRKKDIVARIGGDEFAAVLTDTKESTMQEIIERIRGKFHDWAKEETRYRTNMSLGFSYKTPGQKSAVELYKEADAAMYHEKLSHKSTSDTER
jgi:diguanylate cyclase (GGDEF)-like protein